MKNFLNFHRQLAVKATGLVILASVILLLILPSNKVSAITPTVKSTVEQMNVIEVRYFPQGTVHTATEVDSISSQFQNLISQASALYPQNSRKNLNVASTYIQPVVKKVLNLNGTFPNIGVSYDNFKGVIDQNELCKYIEAYNADQVWVWIDPTIAGGGVGSEYLISNNYVGITSIDQNQNIAYISFVSAFPAFCNAKSFAMLGLDYTRGPELALHSFGHMMEEYLTTLQGEDLFWKQFAGRGYGDSFSTYPNTKCGNMHFPPNSNTDYGYDDTTFVNNNVCESTLPRSFNCTEWGCTAQGYSIWWMNRFFNESNRIVSGQTVLVPRWWDLVANMDAKIEKYANSSYYLNPDFKINKSSYLQNSCSCSGYDSDSNPIIETLCGKIVKQYDQWCYVCTKKGFVATSSQKSC